MTARAEQIAGRTFGPRAIDYLLIGGGLSLLFTVAVVANPRDTPLISYTLLPYLILLSNAAHFAASTVRLYTKPGTMKSLPFLTMAFPLVVIALVTLSIFDAPRLGPQLRSFYLTWSPYHYAAQAYGIAMVYSYRSGCRIGATDKRLLFWVSMLPFLYNFITGPDVGVGWLVPASIRDSAGFASLRGSLGQLLLVLAVATPILLYAKIWRSKSGPLPLISLMSIVSNGVWFLVLGPLDAFVYATVFHGIQYMAIVVIFHMRDQAARPNNRHGKLYHAVSFYAMSLALGYGLFNCLPLAYVFAGFGRVEATLLVVAAINIHHFIVDAFIWRLRPGDSNRQVLESQTAAALSPT